MGKNIFIFELYLVLIFLSYKLYFYIKRDRIMSKERKKRIINEKQKSKPGMRDPILKRG